MQTRVIRPGAESTRREGILDERNHEHAHARYEQHRQGVHSFTEEERAAMRGYAKEVKAARRRG